MHTALNCFQSEEKTALGTPSFDRSMLLKWILKHRMDGHGLDSSAYNKNH